MSQMQTPAEQNRDWDELEFLVAFLSRAGYAESVDIADEVEPEWFICREAKVVWTAMRELSRSGLEVDAFSIGKALRESGAKPSDHEFLKGTILAHPAVLVPPSGLKSRVKALRETYLRRRLAAFGAKLQNMTEADDLVDISSEVSEALGDLLAEGSTGGAQVVDYLDILTTAEAGGAVLPLSRRMNKIVFGIPGLDSDLCAGVGTFGLLAAKTSAGKSALAIQAALASATQGLSPLMVNLEMEREDVGARLVAGITARDSFDILRKTSTMSRQATQDEREAVGRVRGLHVASGEPWKRLEAMIRREHNRKRLDLVIVDYFTLLEPPQTTNRNASVAYQLGDLSKSMKRLASQLGICILALSQFNRGIEDGKEPELHNLRETGQLEQDASFVVMLWTEKAKYEPGEPRVVKMRVAKNRGGKRWGLYRAKYEPALNTFSEIERETEPKSSWFKAAVCTLEDV